ncbi:glycosyl hydrolase [Arthrobacter sp.]|uniref:glycosyl hydrolase n=1 Tax=Arthrobacter sp. TaxID=1667 RepID=UPI003391EC4F
MDRRDFLHLSLSVSAAAALTACTAEPAFVGQGRIVDPVIPTGARKGIGLAVGKKHGVKQLDALGVNWFYTWGSSYPAGRPAQDFVPMIWGRGGVRGRAAEKVRSELHLSGASELLGFNEPDHPGQSDMSVASAIDHWPALEASGLRLGSPSPVQAHGDWLKEFMERAASKDLRVDFITMHSYASPNSESFLEDVQKLYDRYGKPIWITEYAVADWDATAKSPSRYSEKDIVEFMSETATGLRRMPFVERFAWKTRAEGDPIMGASALFRRDGSLTRTGELYRSL